MQRGPRGGIRVLQPDHLRSDMEVIRDRRVILSREILRINREDRILACSCCDRFFLYCTLCNETDRNGYYVYQKRLQQGQVRCHMYQLAYVDGAVSHNGYFGASAGLGVALGDEDYLQHSIHVDYTVDDGDRTNQRAELLAAIVGLEKLQEEREGLDERKDWKHRRSFIIASDSKYVVDGITLWYPAWGVSAFFSY